MTILFQLEMIYHCDVEFNQPKAPYTLNRDNIALIAKFVPKRGPKDMAFICTTTHLLYNPRREDIRLAQMTVLLAGAKSISYQFFS